jgi:pyruvate formate lyase activating enzyme
MLSLKEQSLVGNMRGLISHIQRYSTKDGPGIRTTVFMMGCNLRCLWCSNPETLTQDIKVLYHKNLCQQCGRCVNSAVDGSIVLSANGCLIDREKCGNLLDMIDICPFNAYQSQGTYYTVDELADLILKDKTFFDTSKGGVTFSGGEATLQADFILQVVKILKKHDVHVTLDTAGLFDLDKIKSLIDLTDLILYDIKTYDDDLHISLTQVSNGLILDNLIKLSELNKDIIVRLIIVPNLNDDILDYQNRLNFIKRLPNPVKQIDILPYHQLGIGKYQALGLDYPLKDVQTLSDKDCQKFYDLSIKMNFKTTIGG